MALKQAAAWLVQMPVAPEQVITAHVWLYYFADLPLTSTEIRFSPATLAALPVGTVAVWESHYADRVGLRYSTLTDPTQGWHALRRFGDTVVLFRKVAPAQP